jgi:hypothetical protein
MKNIHFGLVCFPIISISIFFTCFILAAFLFPGSEITHLNFKSESYSLSHNFLSGLGGLTTVGGESNTASAIIFNSSMVLIGATLILFYRRFKDVFPALNDSLKSIYFSKLAKPLGVVAGVLYAGVGLIPHDFHFAAHVFCAQYAFLTLFFLGILHCLTIYHSKHINNRYALGYVVFLVVLLIYLYLMFFGPSIGPGVNFTESDLMLQVIAQKSIVFTFILSILIQVYGFHKLLNRGRLQ